MNIRKKQGTFFFNYSLLMLIIAIGGFGMNAIINTERMRPPSVILFFHILVMYSWYIFVVVQSGLITSNKYALHKKLGLLSIFLAIALVISGAFTVVNSFPRETQKGAVITYNFFILSLFSLFYCLAVYKRHSPNTHKRLILFASLAVLHPALYRFDLIFQVPMISFGLLLILILIIVFYDFKVLKKLHKSTVFGIIVTITFFVTAISLIFSDSWNEFLKSVLT